MDRITRVHIKNVRAIEHIDLAIGPLTVLIGENGAGKSTLIECLELLRKAAEPTFLQQLYTVHRGMPALLRKGAPSLELGLEFEDVTGKQPRVDYRFELGPHGAGAVVSRECLRVGPLPGHTVPQEVLTRGLVRGTLYDQRQRRHVSLPDELARPEQLVIGSFGSLPPQRAIERLLSVLRGIEVHVGFDTLAAWAAQSVQRAVTLRGSTMLLPSDRLTLLGHNLASAWSTLKNLGEAHWRHTMALVRLGLGDAIDSVNTHPDPSGGVVALALKRTDLPEPIPAAYLSDGQLTWLAFVAMVRLNSGRSLLAIDEPELHLHPSLLGRVVSLLTSLKEEAPVVLSTHSDRVLELLEDPVSAMRVCSLDGSKAVVSVLDASELPKWLEKFGDLGALRASGYLSNVLVESPPLDDADLPS